MTKSFLTAWGKNYYRKKGTCGQGLSVCSTLNSRLNIIPLPPSVSSTRSSQTPRPHLPGSSDVVATPTEVTSQGAGRRLSVGSVEETLMNQNQTLVQSPALSVTSADTPTLCDITCSASISEGGATTIIQTDAGREGAETTLGVFCPQPWLLHKWSV